MEYSWCIRRERRISNSVQKPRSRTKHEFVPDPERLKNKVVLASPGLGTYGLK